MGWQEPHEVQERKPPRPIYGRNNPRHQYTLRANHSESSFAEEDAGCWWTQSWPISRNVSFLQRRPTASWFALVCALPLQERHGHSGVSPAKVHKDDGRNGASDTWGEAEAAGIVQPGEEKAQGNATYVHKYMAGGAVKMETDSKGQTALVKPACAVACNRWSPKVSSKLYSVTLWNYLLGFLNLILLQVDPHVMLTAYA